MISNNSCSNLESIAPACKTRWRGFVVLNRCRPERDKKGKRLKNRWTPWIGTPKRSKERTSTSRWSWARQWTNSRISTRRPRCWSWRMRGRGRRSMRIMKERRGSLRGHSRMLRERLETSETRGVRQRKSLNLLQLINSRQSKNLT